MNRVLELFAGSRSIGKAAEMLGYDVFSCDIMPYDNINYQVDVLNFDISQLPWKPDIIWASPPCTSFSVASMGHHWNKDGTPKTQKAILGMEIVKKTIQIIRELKPKIWYIENPRGKLRKLNLVPGIRRTVTYCQYGDSRMKPTDIWTNNTEWIPRPMCKNGDTCHESAPRGSRTGTQGLKNNHERSKIPDELCYDVLTMIPDYVPELLMDINCDGFQLRIF